MITDIPVWPRGTGRKPGQAARHPIEETKRIGMGKVFVVGGFDRASFHVPPLVGPEGKEWVFAL